MQWFCILYIYIYIKFRIWLVLDSSIFVLNNSLATKIKNLDGQHGRKLDSNWNPILNLIRFGLLT